MKTTERLSTLRAALWRAIALTLANRMPEAERARIIATAKHVDATLALSSQLFDRAALDAREGVET